MLILCVVGMLSPKSDDVLRLTMVGHGLEHALTLEGLGPVPVIYVYVCLPLCFVELYLELMSLGKVEAMADKSYFTHDRSFCNFHVGIIMNVVGMNMQYGGDPTHGQIAELDVKTYVDKFPITMN